MNKRIVFSVLAAILFLGGIVLMLMMVPQLQEDPPVTEPYISEAPDETTEPVTDPTEPPTEPPTQPPTEPPTEPTNTKSPAQMGLTAKHAFVYDCGQNHLVYAGGDMNAQLAPASLTKLLTAHVALMYLQEDQVITVGKEVTWIDPLSSVAFLQPGHQLTVRMLIQGLIMQSGNDAAYALAVAAGRSISEDPNLDRKEALNVFMEEMNRQAKLLGMTNTHFVTPDGNDASGHYTTAQDLLTLTLTVLDQPLIMEYGGMATANVVFASGQICTWTNSNYLLLKDKSFYTPEALGLKTGTTTGAGKCLLSVFQTEDGYLLVGVLGSTTESSRYTDTLTLFNLYK